MHHCPIHVRTNNCNWSHPSCQPDVADLRIGVLWECLCLWWLDCQLSLFLAVTLKYITFVWWACRLTGYNIPAICCVIPWLLVKVGLIPIVFMVSEHACLLCEMLCWLFPVACDWLGGTHFSWPHYQTSHFSTSWGWGSFICYMHVIAWCQVVSCLGWCLHRHKASWGSEMFNQGLIRVGSFFSSFETIETSTEVRQKSCVRSKSTFKTSSNLYTVTPSQYL